MAPPLLTNISLKEEPPTVDTPVEIDVPLNDDEEVRFKST